MLAGGGGELNLQEAAAVLKEDPSLPSLGEQRTLFAIRVKEKHKAVIKLSSI